MKIDGENIFFFLKENMVFLIINDGCWFGYWFKFESFYMCSELWVFVIKILLIKFCSVYILVRNIVVKLYLREIFICFFIMDVCYYVGVNVC